MTSRHRPVNRTSLTTSITTRSHLTSATPKRTRHQETQATTSARPNSSPFMGRCLVLPFYGEVARRDRGADPHPKKPRPEGLLRLGCPFLDAHHGDPTHDRVEHLATRVAELVRLLALQLGVA